MELFLFFLLKIATSAHAADAPIPSGTGFTPPAGGSPAAAILQFYNFAFLTAGALALLMTIFGIIRYGASGGIASAKSEGKSYIANAFGGLLLLLLAFLLLFTINPGLTVLSFPSLIPLPEPEGDSNSPPPPPCGEERGFCDQGSCVADPNNPDRFTCKVIESGASLGCVQAGTVDTIICTSEPGCVSLIANGTCRANTCATAEVSRCGP